MSRIRLKFIQAFVDRKTGGPFHYFRRPGFPLVRLPGLPGSEQFMAAYQLALAAAPAPIGAERSKPGTVSAAIMTYYESRAFRTLKGGTPAMRRAILERFREAHGHLLIAAMPPTFVEAVLDTLQPHAARNWLKALRHLMAHCVATGQIAKHKNPTLGILARVPASDGHHTWTDAEIAQFEAHHAIGSKPRLALALGVFTGQRRGDVLRMGRQHVHGDKISVRQQKGGKAMVITLHPTLRAVLATTPSEHLTFLTSRTGRPYAPSDFSDQFRHWCDAAGLPHCSFHGLRKAACRRLAEAGCSPHQIMAITGHTTLAMVAHYTAAVEQERLARDAMAMLDQGDLRTAKGATI